MCSEDVRYYRIPSSRLTMTAVAHWQKKSGDQAVKQMSTMFCLNSSKTDLDRIFTRHIVRCGNALSHRLVSYQHILGIEVIGSSSIATLKLQVITLPLKRAERS